MNPVSEAIKSIWTFRDKKEASPWTNISRTAFADGLEERVRNADAIDTSCINLCGPGTFFRNMAADKPELYAKVGMDLYDNGKVEFAGHKIEANAKLLAWQVGYKVAPVDWVMLASYQNSENFAWGFTSETDGFGGITLPYKLADWHKSIGYSSVENSTNLYFTKGIDHLKAASNYYDHGYRVCLFVNANIMYPNTIMNTSFCPTHWIMLDSSIEFVTRSKVEFIEFRAWSWGKSRRIPETGFVSGQNLTNNYYGFVAARA